MNIKRMLRRVVYGPKAESETYIAYLRSIGVSVGEDVTIYVPTKTTVDTQYPWMITIGNHVRIAQGTVILTHDYSWSVLKKWSHGGIYGASGEVTLGDNVFIGMNAVILPNVRIGNNCVIGAGSVVTRDCPDNGVYVGNPAQKMMDMDQFLEKRRKAVLNEAKALAIQYYRRFGKFPPEEIFYEYFPLFETGKSAAQKEYFAKTMRNCGNFQETAAYMERNRPLFDGFPAFLEYCFGENQP